MEEKQIHSRIFNRNMRLWGMGAFRAEAVCLLTTAINGLVLCVLSKTTTGALYYTLFFFLLFMEMYGMLMQQTEYIKRQLPLALSLGAGRMECVWGMQLANLLLYMQVLLVLGIGMNLEDVIVGGAEAGIRHMEGMELPLLAGALLFMAAVGQLLAVASLKWREQKSIWQMLLFIAGMILSSLTIVFFGVQILYFMDESMRSFFSGVQKVFPELLILMKCTGPIGLILYVLGFFQIKKEIAVYEV